MSQPARERWRGWPWILFGGLDLVLILVAVIGTAGSKGKSRPDAIASPLVSTFSDPVPSINDTSEMPGADGAPTTVSAGFPSADESTGAVTVNAAGAILPDAHRTPGATNAAVTQGNIHSTICVTGWTTTVRPSSSYTTALKEQQLASGYAYHGDMSTADYEEDHLISLEIGGSPTSALNLWPEPYHATDGARVKDVIENKLHALVCDGSISLATAQHAIASNWWTAYLKYEGAAPSIAATTAHAAPAPASRTIAGPPASATALCRDGTYSYAAHHQGACSSHGGVVVFYR